MSPKRSGRTRRTLAAVLAAIVLGGCATSRSVIDIHAAPGTAPSSGPTVVINPIIDGRTFDVAPGDPSVPSLKNKEVGNPAITSRAVARKRNTYGQALGDVLLPEGRTVQALVGEALTQALHSSGYRVLGADLPEDPAAIPVKVEVREFWAWFSPGFWAAHLECRIRIRVVGGPPFHIEGQEFRGYIRLATQGATEGAWKKTIDRAVESLIADIRANLRTNTQAPLPVSDTTTGP